jgi:hypothetical protein
MNDDPNPVGSVFIQPDQVDKNVFNYILVECRNPDARILRLDGSGCSYRNLEVRPSLDRVSDLALITLEGNDSEIRGVKVVTSSTTVGAVGVRLQGKGLTLSGLECNSCLSGFTVTEDSEDCEVVIRPDQVRQPQDHGDYLPYYNYSRTTRITTLDQVDR